MFEFYCKVPYFVEGASTKNCCMLHMEISYYKKAMFKLYSIFHFFAAKIQKFRYTV